MSHSAADPDDLVRKKIDLNHITNMSKFTLEQIIESIISIVGYQMHVPDSITIGPIRSTMPRLHQDDDQLPIRMEVPDRLRPGLDHSLSSSIILFSF
jgi:hypothetical protein